MKALSDIITIYTNRILILLCFLIFILIASINMPELINSTQTGKFIFFSFGIIVIGYLFLTKWLFDTRFAIHLNLLDFLLIILVLYITLNRYWIQPVYGFSMKFYELAGLTMLYVVLRNKSLKTFYFLFIALLLSGIFQAVYGNLQLWGYYASHHSGFKMTGSFFNPGPYAGYLAGVFPIALGIYLFRNKLTGINLNFRFLKYEINIAGSIVMEYVSLIAIITILLVLPASRSRAAWLGVIISSIYLVIIRYNTKGWLLRKINSPLKKTIILITSTLIIFGSVSLAYIYKKDSADGRLLIWKVSSAIIHDFPVFGVGFDRFKAHYMDYQAAYFRDNPEQNTSEGLLADNVYYAFNEPIQFVVEHGFIGLLILILIVVFYVKTRFKIQEKDNHIYHIAEAGFLSILIFSLFSYPGEILPIKICLVFYLAIIANKIKPPFLYKKKVITRPILMLFNFTLILSFSMLTIFLYGNVQKLKSGFTNWQNALLTYQFGGVEASIERYRKIDPIFKDEGDFLMNYGKALSMNNEHKEAIEVLTRSKKHLNTTVIQTALGDSFKELKMYDKAEKAYWQAWYMVPGRFYPKYLLVKLYYKLEKKDSAILIAKELLKKEIKINSVSIKDIVKEMSETIKSFK